MQRASLHLINNAERATHKHRKFENRKERKNDCVQVEWRKSGDYTTIWPMMREVGWNGQKCQSVSKCVAITKKKKKNIETNFTSYMPPHCH